jgi:uncharacterized Ntn-hydrolase superfamily protein
LTYSIVARDPESGQLGVAVQSHWFSVGAVVPWAAPGVGAVATQASAEVSFGPRGVGLMAGGASAQSALAELLAADAAAATRQVGIVDASGATATHTGSLCVPIAGHVVGSQVSCQANMMRSADVWPAMLDAYERAAGPLAERLLAALDAAEAAGGDVRGRQSAALLVVPASGEPWRTVVSLRVEDDPEPLRELRRLYELSNAYAVATAGDDAAALGDHDAAMELYREAWRRAPDNHEVLFWSGLGTAHAGELDAGVADVRAAIALQPGWRRLLADLPAELAPSAAAVLAEIEKNDQGVR